MDEISRTFIDGNGFCGIKQEVKQVKQSEDIPLNLINGKKR